MSAIERTTRQEENFHSGGWQGKVRETPASIDDWPIPHLGINRRVKCQDRSTHPQANMKFFHQWQLIELYSTVGLAL